jgi:D-alanyl-lipoteichoic acid acyltransferase DltB (MBOAT superfamily)
MGWPGLEAHTHTYSNIDRYTFLTYLCYLTYAPLYIAGPIVGYNAFAAQVGFFPIGIFYIESVLLSGESRRSTLG